MNSNVEKSMLGKIVWMTLVFGGVWIFIPFISNDFSLEQFRLLNGLKKMFGVGLIIFINIKFLIPLLYLKDKKGWYILAGVVSVIMIHFSLETLLDPIIETTREPFRGRGRNRGGNGIDWYRQFNRMMPYFLAIVGSAFVEISNYASQHFKEATLLRSEKLETEMKLLKSQINPHFLFNALNNIYSLSYLKPEKTPENLLKLSEMLRYMLYECNVDKVPLSKEIAYLENFIHLKLLKDSRGMKVTSNLEKSNGHLMIAPMLLIPFVENAFKHSEVEDPENGWIDIGLKYEKGKLIFRVENSNPEKVSTKDEVGGIGLPNVKRQLDLLYPKRHQLEIKKIQNKYSVHLEIDLP